ncbi:MAG: hypothetical protein AAF329_20030 [Cyanobacteria bacterium P01_A01_bin.17]
MLNSRSPAQRLSASTFVCMTCLLVTIGGCSAVKTPEASSSTTSGVATEKTSPNTSGETLSTTSDSAIAETSKLPNDVVTEEMSPTSVEKTADSPLTKAEPAQEVPEQFQGEWNSNLAQCGFQGSDGRLEIKAKQIMFYESSGPIQDITSDGDRKLTGKVELSGEGETWQTELELQLSEDQSALTQIMDDNSFVRYRCS